MPRNLSLDLFRGIAALGIIIHHTVAYSGVQYAPSFLLVFTMLIEVPAFFYLSGATFHYINGFRKYWLRLLTLAVSYVAFSLIYVLVVNLYDLITGGHSISFMVLISDWFKMSLFRGTNHHYFTAVNASMWFMPLYFKIMLVYGLILFISGKISSSPLFSDKGFMKKTNSHLVTVIIFIVAILFLFMQSGVSFPGIQIQVLFYGLFFLLGFVFFPVIIRKPLHLCIFFICNIALFTAALIVYQGDARNMLHYKFPPHLIYFFYSFFFLTLTLYLKRFTYSPRNILVWMGKNALYLFFAQGFSTSISTTLLLSITLPWPVKLSLNVLLNFLLCIIIALVLRKLIEILTSPFRFVLNKRLGAKRQHADEIQ